MQCMLRRARLILAIPLLAGLQPIHAWTQQSSGHSSSQTGRGVDIAGEDTSVRPGDDFYRYANGVYLDQLVLPPDRASYSTGAILAENANATVRALLEGNDAGAGDIPAAALARDYYASFLDVDRIEQLGIVPLEPHLRAIRESHSRTALAQLMGQSKSGFMGSIFALDISADSGFPDRYSIQIGQPELGLPDRDYYLSASMQEVRKDYLAYIEKLLGLAGWPEPQTAAGSVLNFEQEMARASWSGEQRRNPIASYNPMPVSELETEAPGFPWKSYLAAAGLGGENHVVVVEKSAVIAIAALFKSTPFKILQAWAAFALMDRAAPYLPASFRDASFALHRRTLEGQEQQSPRWQLGLWLVAAANGMTSMESEANLGDLVGQMYVARFFPARARQQADQLVASLKSTLRKRIQAASWLSEPTRAEALRKVDAYIIQVGSADHWRQYAGLRIDRTDLAGNIERAAAFNWRFRVARLHQPVDRMEWPIQPHIVNAWNDGVLRKIVFSAALLQPPVFSPDNDPAVNYGGLGAIIGHELTHGFDDLGRHFDSEGRIRDWWDPAAAERFQAMARNLGAQFDACAVLPGVFVNGNLTMGENLADLGGLSLALDAYHESLGGKPAPVIDGLSGDQRFFLAFAQVRRGKRTEQSLRAQVLTDLHSPDACRVNIAVRNVNAWYTAFAVQPEQRLYLDSASRVSLW